MQRMETSVQGRGGVITQEDPDRITIRTRLPAGVLSLAQLRGLGEIAEKYGADHLHLTTGQVDKLRLCSSIVAEPDTGLLFPGV